MARTPDIIVQNQLGQLLFQIALLTSEVERLKEENDELKRRLDVPKEAT